MSSKIKKLLPTWYTKLRQKYRAEKHKKKHKEYENLSTQQVFTKIYEEGAWGKSPDPNQKFFSGSGSHDSAIINIYCPDESFERGSHGTFSLLQGVCVPPVWLQCPLSVHRYS